MKDEVREFSCVCGGGERENESVAEKDEENESE